MHEYHGKDLRRGRYSEINRAYLLTTVTRNRKKLFRELFLARILVAELRLATDVGLVETLAWVVMPDHFHWLVVLQGATLGKVMNRVKSRSAVLVNRHLGETGQVWQRGFHDHAIRCEEDIEHIARYIVANPLRAGIVQKLGDYPHWDACWI